jgi:hypothetical protein
MNVRTKVRMDKAQFFDWLEHQERKHELADGRVVMLPYVTRPHSQICTNAILALGARLDLTQFGIHGGEFAIETGDRSVRFADIMVEPFTEENTRSTAKALLLIEVLSPSTMPVDFHEKLDEYKGLAALGSYVICAQDMKPASGCGRGMKARGPMRPRCSKERKPLSRCLFSASRCRVPTSTATSPSGMGDRTEVLAGGLRMSASKYLQVALLPIFQQQPIASEEAKSLFPGRRRENAIRGIARRRARKKGG